MHSFQNFIPQKIIQLQTESLDFGLSDWGWVILFIVVIAIVWALLARSTRLSSKEQETLEQQIKTEALEHETEKGDEEDSSQTPALPEDTQDVQQAALFTTTEDDHVESSEPDDLKKIEGIGPKIQSMLTEIGITSFKELEEADPDKLRETLNDAGLKMINPESWHEQASLAAVGDWDQLEELQDQLTAGRK